jgi:hypothetical protein
VSGGETEQEEEEDAAQSVPRKEALWIQMPFFDFARISRIQKYVRGVD